MIAILKGLLFLLKLLGILILCLLGLVLLLLLLVLFVPVRYKGSFVNETDTGVRKLNARVSFLNPLIRFRLWLVENKVHFTVRVLGFCVKDSDRPKKPKKEKKDKKKKSEQDALKDTSKPEEERAEPAAAGKNAEETKGIQEKNEVRAEEIDAVPSEEEKKEGFRKKIQTVFRNILDKIKNLVAKIKAIPEKIKQKIQKTKAKLVLLVRKKEEVLRFLSEETNKAVVGDAFGLAGKLLKHILPYKIKGSLVFGTGDPESTGKALGVLAVFYPVYAKSLTIRPDFSDKRIDAELTFCGRIRLATLLWRFAGFWWSKETKQFRKKYKKLQQVLKEKAE